MKLFHISSRFLGDDVLLTPKIPCGQSLTELRSPYRKVARICCSDTIEKCLVGITKMKLKDIMFVYKPTGRLEIDWDSPHDACDDWELTDECWIMAPTRFEFKYAIEVDTDIYNMGFKYRVIKSE